MRVVLLAAATAAAVALTASTAAAPGFDRESWADLEHGWATSDGTLFATDDGGRSWRPIFYGGNQIYHVQRTSTSAGTVLTGNSRAVAFWTRDGGRHWYRTTDAVGNAVGHGGLLFWSNAGELLQLKPWPPRGAVRCRGAWWATAFGPGANPRLPKNVCSGRAPLSVQSQRVFTLSRGAEFAPDTLVAVPGGVVGVSTDGSARQRPLSVAVYRNARGTEAGLPNSYPLETGFSGLRLDVGWPRMVLQAEAGSVHVVWTSEDGGVTWSAGG